MGGNILTLTAKMEKGHLKTKARLVARCYEEKDKTVRADLPTCCKENIRMLLAIDAGKKWTSKSLDVKAAFLQGRSIERDVFVEPPSSSSYLPRHAT